MRISFVNIKDEIFNTAIAALSASLKRHGMNASIVNVRLENPDMKKFSEEIRSQNPDVILFSIVSVSWPIVQQAIRIVKENKNPYVICGGYHPTLFPEDVINFSGVDAICVGEGDIALPIVLHEIQKKTPSYEVENFWFKVPSANAEAPNIVKNEIGNLITNLDELPFWDRTLFGPNVRSQTGTSAIEGVYPGFFPKGTSIVTVYSGKGCPYSCTYCSNESLKKLYKGKGKFVRRRSVDNIVEELVMLKQQYDADFFDFLDEAFASNMNWLKTFHKKYKEALNIPFGVLYRVEQVDREKLELLYDAGCRMIYMGVESGNESYRKKYLNRHMSNENILRTTQTAQELGISIITFNMVQMPYETEAEIQQTIDLNKQIDPAFPFFFPYQTFPGTSLSQLCLEKNLTIESTAVDIAMQRISGLKTDIPQQRLDALWTQIETLQNKCLNKPRHLVEKKSA